MIKLLIKLLTDFKQTVNFYRWQRDRLIEQIHFEQKVNFNQQTIINRQQDQIRKSLLAWPAEKA